MASLGLYFSPTDDEPDRVVTYIDGASIANFEAGDDVSSRLAESHPDNPWSLISQSKAAGKESEDRAGTWLYEEDLLPTGHRLIEARRRTFANLWPHDGKKGWKCTSQKLAQAGFHYEPTEESDDMASCAYCARTLGGWEKGDDAVHEHMRKKPECPVFNCEVLPSEPVAAKPFKGKTATTSRTVSTSRRAKAAKEAESAPEQSDADVEDVYEPAATTRGRRGKAVSASSQQKAASTQGSAEEDEAMEEQAEPSRTARSTKPKQAKASTKQTTARSRATSRSAKSTPAVSEVDETDGAEDEEEEQPAKKQTSRSRTKAAQRQGKVDDSAAGETEGDEQPAATRRGKGARKVTVASVTAASAEESEATTEDDTKPRKTRATRGKAATKSKAATSRSTRATRSATAASGSEAQSQSEAEDNIASETVVIHPEVEEELDNDTTIAEAPAAADVTPMADATIVEASEPKKTRSAPSRSASSSKGRKGRQPQAEESESEPRDPIEQSAAESEEVAPTSSKRGTRQRVASAKAVEAQAVEEPVSKPTRGARQKSKAKATTKAQEIEDDDVADDEEIDGPKSSGDLKDIEPVEEAAVKPESIVAAAAEALRDQARTSAKGSTSRQPSTSNSQVSSSSHAEAESKSQGSQANAQELIRTSAKAQLGNTTASIPSSSSSKSLAPVTGTRVFSPLPVRARKDTAASEAMPFAEEKENEAVAPSSTKDKSASAESSSEDAEVVAAAFDPASFPLLAPLTALPLQQQQAKAGNLTVQAYLELQIEAALEEMKSQGEERIQYMERKMTSRRSEIEAVLRGQQQQAVQGD